MQGLFHNILKINLESKTTNTFCPDNSEYKKFIGGRGLGVRVFTSYIGKNVSPLSSSNPIILTIGPMTGTLVPGSNRFSLVTRAPLTNAISCSVGGGDFAASLRSNGIDGVLISEACYEWSYILIKDNGQAQIKDASEFLGLNTVEAHNFLKVAEGENISTLIIGAAGETLSKIASVVINGETNFSRGGIGAVFGSKKIKAVVVSPGGLEMPVATQNLVKLVANISDKIKVSPVTNSVLPKFNTLSFIRVLNELGMFPVNNFNGVNYSGSELLYAETLRKQNIINKENCPACHVNCGGQNVCSPGFHPGLESVWALGANCGVFDINTISEAHYNCLLLGIDPLSAGSVIACTMEMAGKGIINEPDIKFGNKNIISVLIREIAKASGIGEKMAEGAKLMAMRYGATECSMQVKGLDISIFDPRGASGQALGFATANIGGCYKSGFMVGMEIFALPKKIDRFVLRGKADMLFNRQNQDVVEDSLAVCKLPGLAYGMDFNARLLTEVTGNDYDVADLQIAGARIFDMERLYNIAEGFTCLEDKLPERFSQTPLSHGLSAGRLIDIRQMLKEYYQVRGWNSMGVPSEIAVKPFNF